MPSNLQVEKLGICEKKLITKMSKATTHAFSMKATTHVLIATVLVVLQVSIIHTTILARQISAFTVPTSKSCQSSNKLRYLRLKKSSSLFKDFHTRPLPQSLVSLSATSQSSSSSLCSVDLIESETGCEVTLVGCFHGSQSSAADVEFALTSKPTDVVVLELCADRFDDLRNEFEQETRAAIKQKQTSPWLIRYTQMVLKTSQTKGLSTGAAVAVLGGVSGMQTALSGLQPGLEFTTALRIARSSTSSSTGKLSKTTTNIDRQGEMDIVLADQNVDVTLYKMGKLPQLSLRLWQDCFRLGWQASFGKEANALKTALLGGDGNYKYVRLPSFLTRSDAAIRDVLRLTIPPLALVQTFSLAISNTVAAIMPHLLSNSNVNDAIISNSATTLTSSSGLPDDPIFLLMANIVFVILAYISVALPAARVVLSERDDQLTDGIREACRIASAKQPDGKGGRVVAVLGLLHVNGIAQRMLHSSIPSPTADNLKQ